MAEKSKPLNLEWKYLQLHTQGNKNQQQQKTKSQPTKDKQTKKTKTKKQLQKQENKVCTLGKEKLIWNKESYDLDGRKYIFLPGTDKRTCDMLGGCTALLGELHTQKA